MDDKTGAEVGLQSRLWKSRIVESNTLGALLPRVIASLSCKVILLGAEYLFGSL